jgi:aspartyl-tRNA(Asn)/glutamyl-tRNA(Gln) amidotransferase subunit C
MSASKKTVTRQDVLHMAQLSRLTVGEDEIDLFCRQLMDILEKVDTSSVEPLYSPVVHAPTMREDVAENKRTREKMLANAPDRTEEYYVVPRIV